MIVLVGKTCSGKSTIAEKLEIKYGIKRIKTYTTRPRRDNEASDYYYVSDKKFEALKQDGFFFETTQYDIADGSIWKYGTANDSFKEDGVIIMNPDGVRKVRRLLEGVNVTIIYLNVSEGCEWGRIKKRGDSSDEASRRINKDKSDFADIEQYYDYSITTDDLDPDFIAEFIMALHEREKNK